jgi:putative phosphoesterase
MSNLIGLISDAHGNGQAFDRAVDVLLTHGAQRLFFLGDAIGYIPSIDVLDSLARLGNLVQCIRGNHEAMLLEQLSDAAREPVYQFEALRPKLTRAHQTMIASWPVLHTEVIDGQKVLMVHGSPEEPTYGYVYPDTDLSGFTSDADWVFMGNTHHPFIREQAGTRYVNIGSCGMPRDDGRYGSAALFNIETCKVRILRFDITQETSLIMEQFPMVHPSVRDVYERRLTVVMGDIL